MDQDARRTRRKRKRATTSRPSSKCASSRHCYAPTTKFRSFDRGATGRSQKSQTRSRPSRRLSATALSSSSLANSGSESPRPASPSLRLPLSFALVPVRRRDGCSAAKPGPTTMTPVVANFTKPAALAPFRQSRRFPLIPLRENTPRDVTVCFCRARKRPLQNIPVFSRYDRVTSDGWVNGSTGRVDNPARMDN